MGSVWRARNLQLDAPVAVKLMDPAIAADESALMRFHREAHAGAAVRSPHVLQVFDHSVDERTGHPYIVMELLDGEPLSQRLSRLGRLSLEQTAAILSDVCRGLGVAHQQSIIHRDLKPDNVFLEHNQDEEIAKILDFGIAKAPQFAAGPGGHTQTGTVMGTPYYMSPEQIRGAKHVDTRSDLWSVAVIAYECVTGQRPFQADTVGGLALAICVDPITPPTRCLRVPPEVDAFFARALHRDPELRFQTARELAREFAALVRPAAPALSTGRPAATLVEPVAAPAPTRASARSQQLGALARPGSIEWSASSLHAVPLAAPAPAPPIPTAPPLAVPSYQASAWSLAKRHTLLSYGSFAVILIGVWGYSAWMQEKSMQRIERATSGALALTQAPPGTTETSVFSYLLPIGAMLVMVGVTLLRRRSARQEPSLSHLRVGELARRLGLDILEGEPGRHLMLDGWTGSTRVVLAGVVGEHRVELIYVRRTERQWWSRSLKVHFECRLLVYATSAFAPFEVIDRESPLEPVLPLSECNLGPALGAQYRVYASDPRQALGIARGLHGFEAIRDLGVHLVADGRSLAFVMQEAYPPSYVTSLGRAEHIEQALIHMARSIAP